MRDFASAVLSADPVEEQGDFASAVLSSGEPAAPEPAASAPAGPAAEPGQSMAQQIVGSEQSRLEKTSEGQIIKLGQGFVRFGNGVYQTTLDVLESAGIMPEGAADQFTRMKNEEKRAVEAAFKKEFGDDFAFAVSEIAGEILPYFAVPASGGSALTRLLGGMLSGGAAGGLMFSDKEDSEARASEKKQRAVIGAATGGGASVAAEAVSKVKNIVTNTLAKAIDENRAFAVRGLDIQKRTGIKFKLSQLTGDPAVESLETLARAGTKGERVARGIERRQAVDAFKFFRNQLSKIDDNADDFGNRVSKTFEDLMGDSTKGTGLLGARANQARADFGAAEKAGGFVPVGKTVQTLTDLIEEFSTPGATRQSKAMASELASIRDDLLKNGAALKPKALQSRLEEWGRAAKGSGKFFSDKVEKSNELRPAKRLFGALNDDLDEAIQSGEKGADKLRIARDNYAANSVPITEAQETVLGKLFKTKNPSLEDIKAKFLKMRPTEVEAVMTVLSKQDPNIKNGLQRFWLQSFLDKAKSPGQADALQFIPAKMLDIKKDRKLYKAVFSDPKVRTQVNEGLEAVSRIMMNNATTGGRTVNRLRQVAGLMARNSSIADKTMTAMGDIFAPHLVTKYVLDRNGVRALQELAKPVNQNRLAAATAVLVNIALRGEPAEPATAAGQPQPGAAPGPQAP